MQPDQRVRQRLRHRLERHVRRQAEVFERAIERGAAIERDHDVVLRAADDAPRPDRLAALGHARDDADLGRERNARQPAAVEHRISDLHAAPARGGQAAEQVAAGGALGQLGQQLLQVGHAAIGMHQRRIGMKVSALGTQRLHPREHAEGAARQGRKHQRERRYIEVLGAGGGHADAHGAHPMHAGQAQLQLGEDGLGVAGKGVGEVAQAKRVLRRQLAATGRMRGGDAGVVQHVVERAGERHPPVTVGGMACSEGDRLHEAPPHRKSSSTAATCSGWSCCRLWPASAMVITRTSAKQPSRRCSSSGSSASRSFT